MTQLLDFLLDEGRQLVESELVPPAEIRTVTSALVSRLQRLEQTVLGGVSPAPDRAPVIQPSVANTVQAAPASAGGTQPEAAQRTAEEAQQTAQDAAQAAHEAQDAAAHATQAAEQATASHADAASVSVVDELRAQLEQVQRQLAALEPESAGSDSSSSTPEHQG